MKSRHFSILLIAIALTGCLSRPERHLRAQPVAFMDLTDGGQRVVQIKLAPMPGDSASPVITPAPQKTVAIPASSPTLIASLTNLPVVSNVIETPQPQLKPETPAPGDDDQINIRCIRTPSVGGMDRVNNTDVRQQCLYVGVDWQDILRLPIRNKAERNRAIGLLVNLSDSNCSVFTTRLLGTKASLDATRNSFRELATATSAGTAAALPGLSAIVGLANMVGGTSLDNISAAFYADKTSQAVTAAITAERARTQKILFDGLLKDMKEYTYFQGVKDWQAYDHACSLESGLEQLLAIANKEATAQLDNASSERADQIRDLKAELEAAKSQRTQLTDLLANVNKQLAESDAAQRQALGGLVTQFQSQISTSSKEIDELREKIKSLTTPPPATLPDGTTTTTTTTQTSTPQGH
ncbi:MAG TPA: hypothetical protein VFN10_03020 [Thermoanaerobaculia bacterium]|nr:hypothetical protein [Thermoanaerobaculia bacterium]